MLWDKPITKRHILTSETIQTTPKKKKKNRGHTNDPNEKKIHNDFWSLSRTHGEYKYKHMQTQTHTPLWQCEYITLFI